MGHPACLAKGTNPLRNILYTFTDASARGKFVVPPSRGVESGHSLKSEPQTIVWSDVLSLLRRPCHNSGVGRTIKKCRILARTQLWL